MAQPPKMVQAALLFDQLKPLDLNELIRQFRDKAARIGTHYNLVFDTKPGVFYRLFGDDVMITVEYIAGPAKSSVFEATLASPFTRIANKEARERLARHRSHILVEVHHGAIPPTSEITALLEQMSVDLPFGASAGAFEQRVTICNAMCLLAHKMGKASLVHWTASDHLIEGDVYAQLALEPMPSLLHIHPLPFGCGQSADGRDQIEIKTFGASHFIDREIHVAASPLPFCETWKLISVFLKVALADKGYIVPDDDTFGDEAQSLSCRVRHIAAGAKSGDFAGPLYRLEPLFSREYGFRSPDYVSKGRAFDDRTVPPDVLAGLGDTRDAVIEEWRAKRQLAEGVGGQFEVRRKGPPDTPRPFGRRTSIPGA